MASNSPTRFSTVATFSATVLAAATVSGYVAYFNGNTYQAGTQEVTTASGVTVTAGGGRFIATNLADAACRKTTNGRYYDCYQEVVFSNTGASFGTSTYYNVASITKPFSGSGSIKKVSVSCDGQPVATNVSVDQLSSLTGSGTGLLNKVAIGSGALRAYGSGGGVIWKELTPYIKVSASARVGNSNCMLSVESNEMYNP